MLTYYLRNLPPPEVKTLADKLNLPVINFLDALNYNHFTVGPAEFVWLFANASLVFTNSFHGIVFSILFKRPFINCEFKGDKDGANVESRITSLLKLFGLQDQRTIPLGDAWGVQKFAPNMFDDRGTSVIFIHTAKGETFLKQTNLIVQPVHFFDVMTNNAAFIVPLTADPRRKNFFAHIAQIADKFAVMQHYAYQDDRAIRKQIGEQNQRAMIQSCQAIAAQLSNKK